MSHSHMTRRLSNVKRYIYTVFIIYVNYFVQLAGIHDTDNSVSFVRMHDALAYKRGN